MAEILTAFANAFSASLLVAAPAALLWGALSVGLSPCHLSSVPLVVAYMGGDAEPPVGRRALAISSAFARHAAAIAVAGASFHSVQRWLGWKAGARAVEILRAGAGLAVLGGGAYFVYTAL